MGSSSRGSGGYYGTYSSSFSASNPSHLRLFSVVDYLTHRHPQYAPYFALLEPFTDAHLWKLYHSPLVQAKQQRMLLVRAVLFDRFIEKTLQMVESYIYKKMPDHSLVDREDLQQEVMIALHENLDKYDPSLKGKGGGNNFMQYFNSHRLMGSIVDTLRRMMPFPRIIATYRKILKPLLQELEQELGHPPTKQEFAERHPESYRFVNKKKVMLTTMMQDSLTFSGVFNQQETNSNSDQDYGDGDDGIGNYLPKESNPDPTRPGVYRQETLDAYGRTLQERTETKHKILAVITDEKERLAVYYYHWLHKNNEWIAERLECTTGAAAKKKKAGEEKIKQHFTREEIEQFLRK